jgi:hypothetical protein
VPWLKKFFAHGDGVAICRAYTSSDWWHEVVIPNAQTLLFPNGKTKFIRPNGAIGTAPGHGVALIGMGEICNAALRDCRLGWFVSNRRGSMKRFAAEALFLNPNDVPVAAAALAAAGCKFEIDPDATSDPPTVFGMITGTSELAEEDIGGSLQGIVWPLGGDVVEWSYGPPWKIRD